MRVDVQTEVKLRFYLCWRTLSHEWVNHQQLKKDCKFTCPGATLSHEMRVHRQKLR